MDLKALFYHLEEKLFTPIKSLLNNIFFCFLTVINSAGHVEVPFREKKLEN